MIISMDMKYIMFMSFLARPVLINENLDKSGFIESTMIYSKEIH